MQSFALKVNTFLQSEKMTISLKNLGQNLNQWISSRLTPGPSSENLETADSTNESLFQSMVKKLRALKTASGVRADKLAESLARQITSWTGQNTTPEQVKKGIQNGAILGSIMATFLVAREMSNQLVSHNSSTQAPPSCSAGHVPNFVSTLSDEEFHEQTRVEQDHLDYVDQQEQNQYFDQVHDLANEQISYNETWE